MNRVLDKVAIVTGAASGLGAADAALLANEGATVILTDLNEELGRSVSMKIPRSIFLAQDVCDEARWIALIQETITRFGRLDILVNNAGIVTYSNIEETTLEQYRKINAVISEGTFLGCKHAIGAMKRGAGGSIINMSSIAATRGFASVTSYTAAKGAVVSLTRNVATHCLEHGYAIRCNAILPGAHDTPMTRAALIEGPAAESGFDPIRMGLQGAPIDVANLVLFLASDESRRITGTSVVIDNGQTAK
jgi:3(or 17)beta-hydroxysteroid dehydrogenase